MVSVIITVWISFIKRPFTVDTFNFQQRYVPSAEVWERSVRIRCTWACWAKLLLISQTQRHPPPEQVQSKGGLACAKLDERHSTSDSVAFWKRTQSGQMEVRDWGCSAVNGCWCVCLSVRCVSVCSAGTLHSKRSPAGQRVVHQLLSLIIKYFKGGCHVIGRQWMQERINE